MYLCGKWEAVGWEPTSVLRDDTPEPAHPVPPYTTIQLPFKVVSEDPFWPTSWNGEAWTWGEKDNILLLSGRK